MLVTAKKPPSLISVTIIPTVSRWASISILAVTNIGGLDTRVLPATEVTVYGKEQIYGLVTSTPPHLRKLGADSVPKIDELYVDTGYTKEELDTAVGEVKKAKKRKKVITIEVDEDDSTYDSLAISEERAEKLRKRREKENERAEAEAIARHAEKEAAAEKSALIEKSPLKDDVKKDSEDKE